MGEADPWTPGSIDGTGMACRREASASAAGRDGTSTETGHSSGDFCTEPRKIAWMGTEMAIEHRLQDLAHGIEIAAMGDVLKRTAFRNRLHDGSLCERSN